MSGFLRLVSCEWYKIQKWLILILLIVGPVLSVGAGQSFEPDSSSMDKWLWIYTVSTQQYAWMFYPVLTGVFAALICRYEHTNGGWKQLLAQPVSRTQIYLAKAFLLAAFAAASQLIFVLLFALGAWWNGLSDTISWGIVMKSALAGWIAVLPLAALQLWISFLWRSFGVPLAINIALSLPSILAAQSETFGPFYPWAQPMLAMIPKEGEFLNVNTETLVFVVIGGFLITSVGGWLNFVRRDMEA